MSMSEIKIYRTLPVINGFVQLPTAKRADKSRVTPEQALVSIQGSTQKSLTMGSGNPDGKNGAQRIFELPGVTPQAWYTTPNITNI